MFNKIMIANRGEIAVRVMRTCREMNIPTVAVYSDIDVNSLHVKLADESYRIGSSEASHGYLDMEEILRIAWKSHADAIHPGYGFLSENPAFVAQCNNQGITFIGPSLQCMSRAKPKEKARQTANAIGIPVVPGSNEAILCDNNDVGIVRAIEQAETVGYPVIVKPSGGGGGIGMKIADNENELICAIRHANGRGKRAFGLSSFYIEKYLPDVKHVEIQVIADRMGNVIHVGDRDCSIQRRFQKLIEESPCPVLPQEIRGTMSDAAIKVATALGCDSLMTVEFLYVPATHQFFFNEVNCRLQVEHSISELVTGIDMVREQIRIAAGEKLGLSQSDVAFTGHALECRITAEDSTNNFLPCPGMISNLHLPHGPSVRVDEGIYEGIEISLSYDPMICKIITWGKNRHEAVSRMKRALNETEVGGIMTTLPFHRRALDTDGFADGTYTTNFVKTMTNHLSTLRDDTLVVNPPSLFHRAVQQEVVFPQ